MKDLKIEKLKDEILGKDYDLSFSFVYKNKIHELNKIYRSKDKPTDILSFPLDKKSGEILICKEIAKQKSKDFDMTPKNYLLFLTVHGMLHLKGFKHGEKMEKLEKKYYKKFIES